MKKKEKKKLLTTRKEEGEKKEDREDVREECYVQDRIRGQGSQHVEL